MFRGFLTMKRDILYTDDHSKYLRLLMEESSVLYEVGNESIYNIDQFLLQSIKNIILFELRKLDSALKKGQLRRDT